MPTLCSPGFTIYSQQHIRCKLQVHVFACVFIHPSVATLKPQGEYVSNGKSKAFRNMETPPTMLSLLLKGKPEERGKSGTENRTYWKFATDAIKRKLCIFSSYRIIYFLI